jgi:hypothetical protein
VYGGPLPLIRAKIGKPDLNFNFPEAFGPFGGGKGIFATVIQHRLSGGSRRAFPDAILRNTHSP